MADVLTVAAVLLVAAAAAGYVYQWPTSDRDTRLGDGLFLVGVALVLFADDLTAGVAVDVAVAVGAVLLVGGLSVKLVRPFTPTQS